MGKRKTDVLAVLVIGASLIGGAKCGHFIGDVFIFPSRHRAIGSSVTLKASYNCGSSNIRNIFLSWILGSTEINPTNCMGRVQAQDCIFKNSSCQSSGDVSSRSLLIWNSTTAALDMVMEFRNLSIHDRQKVYVADSSNASGFIMSEMLDIKYCENIVKKQEERLLITNGNLATFGTVATYECSGTNSSLYVNGFHDSSSYERNCQHDASWSGTDEVYCFFAPTNVLVGQGSYTAEEQANFFCNYTEGFPNSTKTLYYVDGQVVEENVTLKPKFHSKNFHCEVENNYTLHVKQRSRSASETLVVYFSPYIINHTKGPLYVNSSAEIFFYFRANNASGSVNATFFKADGNELIEASSTVVLPEAYFNFTYTVTISNSSTDYGNYTFYVSTTHPPGSDYQTINIVDKPPLIEPPSTGNIGLIAGVVGGAVFVIILLVTFLLVRRCRTKNANEDSVKEERENPLYGSTSLPGTSTATNKNKDQTKEEKANPLYQTSSGDGHGIEEAYAEVGTKKRKKTNAGSQNSAFSSENLEVTYAAVNKPKNNVNNPVIESPQGAVYSEVQKKKKGPEGQSRRHGQTEI